MYLDNSTKSKRLFKLDLRLQVCADMVKRGSKVADIGTDHAYLPIWLCKNNIACSAIASDIRREPLNSAKKHILQYGAEDFVTTRLSDGLKEFKTGECDCVIIAGMGGELIRNIILSADWVKNKDITLILQPMTKGEIVRKDLSAEGFDLIEEKSVMAMGKVYTVMKWIYSGNIRENDDFFNYMGLLVNDRSDTTQKYIDSLLHHLRNKYEGYKSPEILDLINKIAPYGSDIID